MLSSFSSRGDKKAGHKFNFNRAIVINTSTTANVGPPANGGQDRQSPILLNLSISIIMKISVLFAI